MLSVCRLAGTALLAGAVLLSASCGYGVREHRLPETGASLEGTVKYGAEPVHLALIIVTGSQGSMSGNVDENTGRYKIDNVPVGEVSIGVNVEAAKGELQGKLMSGYYAGPEAKAKGRVTPPKVLEVPAKYQNPETSGIKTTVAAGPNTFDIVIPK